MAAFLKSNTKKRTKNLRNTFIRTIFVTFKAPFGGLLKKSRLWKL